jgi:hypothetical protein
VADHQTHVKGERNTIAMELGIHFVNSKLPGGPHVLGPTIAK